MEIVKDLVKKYPPISDQIEVDEIEVILSELHQTLSENPESNIVEFGCYVGTTTVMIRRLMDTLGVSGELWAYDSFAGLPEKDPIDMSAAGEMFRPGELAVSKKQFLSTFKKAGLKPPDQTIKSWFSEIDDSQVPESIGFAFLDGDYYESIMQPFDLIEHKLNDSATIIIDDYDNPALPGASRAVEDWLTRSPVGKTYKLNRVQASLAILRR